MILLDLLAFIIYCKFQITGYVKLYTLILRIQPNNHMPKIPIINKNLNRHTYLIQTQTVNQVCQILLNALHQDFHLERKWLVYFGSLQIGKTTISSHYN